MRASPRIGLSLASVLLSVGAAHAAAPTEGAFADSFQDGKVACFTKAAIAELRADTWRASMKKRGKDCRITESDAPLPTVWRWQANCTGEHNTAHRYKFSVTLPGVTGDSLVIDSAISDATGELKHKKAFFGEFRGACTAETPTFAMWEYFDLPDRRALEAVARDLLYCGTLYTGLSLKVPAGKRDAVANLGASLTASAATVLPNDPEFLKRELESVSNRVATEIVDASGEKLGKLAQAADCKTFLQENGIDTAIRKRSAALNP